MANETETPVTRDAIAEWIDAAQAKQPEGTLAIFVYLKDGRVHLGRGDTLLEMNRFETNDLPIAQELIVAALEQAFENGPTDHDEQR